MALEHPPNVITLLISEREEWFTDMVARVVHRAAGADVNVMAFTPSTVEADDLFRTAARHQWDFAVLLLNNICYPSGIRTSRGIAQDSIDFVMKMAIVFNKPIFALHGLDEGNSYDERLRDAGASAVYRLPFALDDMVPAVRKYSGIAKI